MISNLVSYRQESCAKPSSIHFPDEDLGAEANHGIIQQDVDNCPDPVSNAENVFTIHSPVECIEDSSVASCTKTYMRTQHLTSIDNNNNNTKIRRVNVNYLTPRLRL